MTGAREQGPVFVWEISREQAFRRLASDHSRLFSKREDAEALCLPVAEQAHARRVAECQDYIREDPDAQEEFQGEEERAWWMSGPELAIDRTESATFYGCGDPEWDSRDRRGAAYGWIVHREMT